MLADKRFEFENYVLVRKQVCRRVRRT